MSDTPVTTSRRAPTERIMPGDRAAHLDGLREGLCVGIIDETSERIMEWDRGGRETLLPGYLQRLVGERLSA